MGFFDICVNSSKVKQNQAYLFHGRRSIDPEKGWGPTLWTLPVLVYILFLVERVKCPSVGESLDSVSTDERHKGWAWAKHSSCGRYQRLVSVPAHNEELHRLTQPCWPLYEHNLKQRLRLFNSQRGTLKSKHTIWHIGCLINLCLRFHFGTSDMIADGRVWGHSMNNVVGVSSVYRVSASVVSICAVAFCKCEASTGVHARISVHGADTSDDCQLCCRAAKVPLSRCFRNRGGRVIHCVAN